MRSNPANCRQHRTIADNSDDGHAAMMHIQALRVASVRRYS